MSGEFKMLPEDGPTQAEVDRFVTAAGSGDKLAVIEFLHLPNANLDALSYFGGATALTLAAQKGDKGAVEFLLENGGSIDARNREECTALYCAAKAGNKEIVGFLIKQGAEIDARDSIGWTPLIYAILSGKEEIAEMLLDAGADVNIKTAQGYTAWLYAVEDNKKEVMEVFHRWERRKLEREANELAAEISDFSPQLKRGMQAPRKLNAGLKK